MDWNLSVVPVAVAVRIRDYIDTSRRVQSSGAAKWGRKTSRSPRVRQWRKNWRNLREHAPAKEWAVDGRPVWPPSQKCRNFNNIREDFCLLEENFKIIVSGWYWTFKYFKPMAGIIIPVVDQIWSSICCNYLFFCWWPPCRRHYYSILAGERRGFQGDPVR